MIKEDGFRKLRFMSVVLLVICYEFDGFLPPVASSQFGLGIHG